MPVSPQDFGAVEYKAREPRFWPPRPPNPFVTFIVIAVVTLPITAFAIIFTILPYFRTPVGNPRNIEGVVESVGFSRRGSLIASVQLANGAVVHVRAPYSAKLSSGSPVTLLEQPLRWGQPAYIFLRAPATPTSRKQ